VFYADGMNLLGDTAKRNTETITDASKLVGLDGNAEKANYMLLSRHQNAEQNYDIVTANSVIVQIFWKDNNKS
jgi:hypothetical protein